MVRNREPARAIPHLRGQQSGTPEGAAAVLLEEEVAYATRGPVWAKAGAFVHVKDLHTLVDGTNDGILG